MAAAAPDDDVSVRDNAEALQFEVFVGEEPAGLMRYEPRGERVVAYVHTEVDPRFGGRGLAGRLVEFALAEARERGWTVLSECPFVTRYVGEHPEHADVTG